MLHQNVGVRTQDITAKTILILMNGAAVLPLHVRVLKCYSLREEF
jgi:hypothetical protein